MRRWAVLGSSLWMLACSNLTEGPAGVVELDIVAPDVTTIEVGETLQLSARALNRDGQSIDAVITWRTPNPTLSVSETGLVTAIAPGPGQVQAFAGSLASSLISLTVVARADTLILIGDSIVTVAPEATASVPLVVQLQSLSPAGLVASSPVIYTVTSPPDVGPHTIELPGGVLVDTLSTGEDGTVQGVTLNRVLGTTAPDSAIVEVRAFRLRGTEVPGSGQRFIVRFQ